MTESESRRRRGCFKTGCLGCLGAFALVVVGLVVLSAIGLGMRPAPKIEESHEEQPLPRPQRPAPEDAEAPAPAEAAGPGTVLLDFSLGDLQVRPGQPGEPIRVEGDYDASLFELTTHFEQQERGAWTYELRLERKASLFQLFGNRAEHNRLRLILPPDAPIALRGTIGVGRSRLELGGMNLTEVDLSLGIGEHELSFDEPLAAPLTLFALDSSIGRISVDHLGNASPGAVVVGHTIGETTLDLRGAWSRDADVDLHCGIGECRIQVPDDISVELAGGTGMIGSFESAVLRTLPPPGTEGVPTLHLDVGSRMGEVLITD